ncbi:MAG: 50S ribosomal protein L23 [Candidatus Cloacimonadota bacterium]|nr:MAG: 50S ribosomal protein L23 [Candidatus Cloacimonadota bacterium]
MRDPREIVINPIITEKGANLKKEGNANLFKIAINANKIEVKKAIEEMFDVKVKKINIIRQRGKVKKLGRYTGKRPDWKKAVVFLAKDENIRELEAL